MKTIDKWSPVELASQVVFPRLNVVDYIINSDYKSRIIKLVAGGIGGFCLFGGNIEENIKVINELQIFTEIPLLFCGDFENGISMRLTEGTEFPHLMAMGKYDNEEHTLRMASLIAQESKAIGAYWNLAPVADINNNPENPVINIRSFGETPELVSKHTVAYIDGTQSEKVLACAKHFPGHGNTEINSHIKLPILDLSPEELEERELIPFKSAISNGVKSIMVGHLSVPSLDESNLPATLSKKIISDLLRNKMGFNGLIITDALEMKAITELYSVEQIAKLSVEAGVNVLLMPDNDDDMIENISRLAQSNIDYRNLLKDSVELIISAKRWSGIMPQYHHESMNANLFTEHPYKALKYAYKAMKITGNEQLIPFKDIKSIAVFSILQRSEYFDNSSRFMKMLSDATDFDIDFAYLDENIEQENIDEFIDQTMESEILIFPIFFKNHTYSSSTKFPDSLKSAIQQLSEGKKSLIIFFGSPYYENELTSDIKILTYSDSYASLAAVVVKLSGRSIDWIED
jgi:beta-glucosidase-like glycosyl hydrolase